MNKLIDILYDANPQDFSDYLVEFLSKYGLSALRDASDEQMDEYIELLKREGKL